MNNTNRETNDVIVELNRVKTLNIKAADVEFDIDVQLGNGRLNEAA